MGAARNPQNCRGASCCVLLSAVPVIDQSGITEMIRTSEHVLFRSRRLPGVGGHRSVRHGRWRWQKARLAVGQLLKDLLCLGRLVQCFIGAAYRAD